MKNQALFSVKDRSKKLNCRLLQFFCLALYGLTVFFCSYLFSWSYIVLMYLHGSSFIILNQLLFLSHPGERAVHSLVIQKCMYLQSHALHYLRINYRFEKIVLIHCINFKKHLTYNLRGAWHTLCPP